MPAGRPHREARSRQARGHTEEKRRLRAILEVNRRREECPERLRGASRSEARFHELRGQALQSASTGSCRRARKPKAPSTRGPRASRRSRKRSGAPHRARGRAHQDRDAMVMPHLVKGRRADHGL